MYKLRITSVALLSFFLASNTQAQSTKLTLDLTKTGVKVSPMLYGLMTEEINHSYDGGLYAELIKNRIFKDNPNAPDAWSVVKDGDAKADIKLIAANQSNIPADEQRNAINGSLTTCLRLTVEKAGTRSGISNEGYWGIPVKPQTTYRASFYIKGGGTPVRGGGGGGNRPAPAPTGPVIPDEAAGPINVSIESKDGKTIYATGTINLEKSIFWKKYEVKLTTGANFKAIPDARFVISTNRVGIYYFNLVSLFPPTYNNRVNGNRPDIMKMMVDMKPKFLRFPGGNYLEGPYLNDMFPWKTTLGQLEDRPGHNGSWGYRASDGLGLHEFLEWCEDVHMEPVLGVYAGYSLRNDHVDAGPLLKTYINDALDEIEYVTGSVNTYWGKKRAENGHPAPFKLTYVEIGNEDWFDRTNTYDARFTQFRNAIKAKYPKLQLISTIADAQYPTQKVTSSQVDVLDEHYYRKNWDMQYMADKYDTYSRKGPKIFVGEWATQEGSPTTNLNSALGDAVWMTGMERNSDLVIMSCYAPAFTNVNTKPNGWQWNWNLIGYNGLNSYGSPAYYAQKMFSNYLGDNVVNTTAQNLPMHTRPATRRDSTANTFPKPVPSIYFVATKDSKTGTVYLKVVNTEAKAQSITIDLKGAIKVAPTATLVELKSAKSEDTNTIDDPEHIIPVTSKIQGIAKTFTREFAPYSVSVIQLQPQLNNR
jgi:alpha-L-arabinofuranosidase